MTYFLRRRLRFGRECRAQRFAMRGLLANIHRRCLADFHGTPTTIGDPS